MKKTMNKYIIQYKHKNNSLGAYFGICCNDEIYMTGLCNEAFRFNSKKEAKDFIRHNLDKNDKYVIKKYE